MPDLRRSPHAGSAPGPPRTVDGRSVAQPTWRRRRARGRPPVSSSACRAPSVRGGRRRGEERLEVARRARARCGCPVKSLAGDQRDAVVPTRRRVLLERRRCRRGSGPRCDRRGLGCPARSGSTVRGVAEARRRRSTDRPRTRGRRGRLSTVCGLGRPCPMPLRTSTWTAAAVLSASASTPRNMSKIGWAACVVEEQHRRAAPIVAAVRRAACTPRACRDRSPGTRTPRSSRSWVSELIVERDALLGRRRSAG